MYGSRNRWMACIAALAWLVLAATPAGAALVNPLPGVYGDDDGTETFVPGEGILAIELMDHGDVLPTAFGFFFVSDPATYIPLFGVEDQNPDPGGPGSVTQLALADMAAGLVYDLDAGNALQNTFSGSGEIGFWLFVDATSRGGGPMVLHSIPSMNPGGLDLCSTFPLLSQSGVYMIGFEEPSSGATLALEAVVGVNPAAVPEPGSWILLGTGLAALAGRRARGR